MSSNQNTSQGSAAFNTAQSAGTGAHLNGSGPSGNGRVSVVDIQPFPGEPTFLRYCYRSRKRDALLVLAPVVVTIVVLIVLGFMQPPQQVVMGRLCADIRKLTGFDQPLNGDCSVGPSAWFPITRDIYSAIGIVILAATPFVIRKQWGTYTRLISSMVGRGAIQLLDDGSLIRSQMSRANRRIRSAGRLAPIIVIVIALAVVELIGKQSRSGMFYTLYPGQGDIATWAKEAYSNWWASPEKGVLGYGLYFIVATWGVYIITQQNIVGYCIIEGLWRSRSAIRFGADPVNTDGYFGWAVVRESLVATYTELAMHGVALACVAITMPPGSLVGPMAVASFQWMVSLPVHLGFPFLFVGRTIRRFKADELERLDNTVQAIDPTLPEHEKIAIQDTISRRMEVIRSVPTLPFKSFRDTSIFVISLIADSAAVIALLLVLFHI